MSELYWSAPVTQWWFVMTRPSGDTKLAEHPPSHTTAPSGNSVGRPSALGSIVKPSFFSVSACAGICSGIHIPPGFKKPVGFVESSSPDAVAELDAVGCGWSGRLPFWAAGLHAATIAEVARQRSGRVGFMRPLVAARPAGHKRAESLRRPAGDSCRTG